MTAMSRFTTMFPRTLAAGVAATILFAGVNGAQAQGQVADISAAARPVLMASTPISEHIIVRDAVVTLGDLFAGLSDRTQEPVGPAPAPGSHMVYDLPRLAALAKAHNIAWQPRTWSDRVVVERASLMVGQADIEAALRKALQRRGLAARSEIELSGKAPQIQLPAGASSALQIEQLEYDERSGRFNATVVADTMRLPIAGRVVTLV
jgi:flagella basal body P-ring formation protein FlgA